MKSRAPHKTQPVYCKDDVLVPVGVGEMELRAEEFIIRNGRFVLTLSDYYADEYYINMGIADTRNSKMREFLERATEEKSYFRVEAHKIIRKDLSVFYKPMIRLIKDKKAFTY